MLPREEASVSRRESTSCFRSWLLLSSTSITLRLRAMLSSSSFPFASLTIWSSRPSISVWSCDLFDDVLAAGTARWLSRSMSSCIESDSIVLRFDMTSISNPWIRSWSWATTGLPWTRSAVRLCSAASLFFRSWMTPSRWRSLSPTTAFPTETTSERIHPPSSVSCPWAIARRCERDERTRIGNSVFAKSCDAATEFAPAMVASSRSASHCVLSSLTRCSQSTCFLCWRRFWNATASPIFP
mmetsp:Transcript_24146/g.57566  ORF Transcript_24146/g.57566 Transcript_24146/m.57566 type:complete len:241 (-) Transcript_24146:519-1241(-)